MYVCMYAFMYVCMYVYMYVCMYVSTDSTVSVDSRQQSALQLFGFIIEAPATVICIAFRCIIVCRGSRTGKESVSAICWCGVEM